MKAILFLVVALGVVSGSLRKAPEYAAFEREAGMDIYDAIYLVQGIFEGLNIKNEFNNIEDCLVAIPETIKGIMECITKIMEINWKDFEEVINLISKMFNVIADLIRGLIPCAKVPKDFEILLEKLSHIDPEKMLARLVLRMWDIFELLSDMLAQFKEGHFKVAGQDIGKTVYIILLEEDEALNSNAEEFFKGLFKELNVKGDFNKILACIGNLDEIYSHFLAGISLLKEWVNVTKGIKEIKLAIGMLLDRVNKCVEGWNDLKEILTKISKLDISEIVAKVLEQPLKYIFLALDFINKIKGQLFGDAGKALGVILRELLFEEMKNLAFTFDDFVKMIEGFLTGINYSHHMENIEECAHNITEIYKDFLIIIDLIKKIDWKNLEKLIDALKKLFDSFKAILDAVRPCMKTPGDIDYFIKKFEELLKDPSKLITRILGNIIQITSDIMAALKHLGEGNYKDFGKDIGDLIARLVLGDQLDFLFLFLT